MIVMLSNAKLYWYILTIVYVCTLLGCGSQQCDNYDGCDSNLIMDDDFGFCGYIACVENHDVLHYKLPDCKDFPNQYQYDSILLEISGDAKWELVNGQVQVRQVHGAFIVMFCCNHDEWDTAYFYARKDYRPIVKRSIDTIYEKTSIYMLHGKYHLYDSDGQDLLLEYTGDSLFKEAEEQETEFKYRIRLTR